MSCRMTMLESMMPDKGIQMIKEASRGLLDFDGGRHGAVRFQKRIYMRRKVSESVVKQLLWYQERGLEGCYVVVKCQ